MKKIILISGYPAVGKTGFGLMAEKEGGAFLDCDKIVQELYQVGHEGYELILSELGKGFFEKNGLLDREKLRNFAFASRENLLRLNDLIHPLVKYRINFLLENCENFFVAIETVYPLLFLEKNPFIVEIKSDLSGAFSRAAKRGINQEMYNFIMQNLPKDYPVDFIWKNNLPESDFAFAAATAWKKILKRVGKS